MSATASTTDNTVLSVSDLTVRFAGAPANVVDGVSFSVKRGKTPPSSANPAVARA